MSRQTPAASLGKLRFRGLDPEASYRVDVIQRQPVPPLHRVPWLDERPIVLSGRTLMEVGLRAPHMFPSTVTLFDLTRVEPPDRPA